jgi:hypothetical protein
MKGISYIDANLRSSPGRQGAYFLNHFFIQPNLEMGSWADSLATLAISASSTATMPGNFSKVHGLNSLMRSSVSVEYDPSCSPPGSGQGM